MTRYSLTPNSVRVVGLASLLVMISLCLFPGSLQQVHAQPMAVNPRFQLQVGHSGPVYSAQFSDDGQTLITGNSGEVYLWDVATGRVKGSIVADVPSPLTTFDYVYDITPGGDTVAMANINRSITLWKVRDATPIRSLKAFTGAITAISYSKDGKYLSAGSKDGICRLWQVKTGKLIQSFSAKDVSIIHVSVSHNNQMLAACGTNGLVWIWSVQSGRCIQIIHPDKLDLPLDRMNASFCGNDTHILTNPETGSRRLWNIRTGHCDAIIAKDTSVFTMGRLSHNSDFFAEAAVASGSVINPDPHTSYNAQLQIWDMSTGKITAYLKSPDLGQLYRMAWAPDGRTLATVDITFTKSKEHGPPLNQIPSTKQPGQEELSRYSLRLWDAQSGKLLNTLGKFADADNLSISADGKLLAITTDKAVKMWDMATGAVQLEIPINDHGIVNDLCFSHNSKLLAGAGEDGRTRVWDMQTGERKFTCNGGVNWINSTALSPDRKWLVSGTFNRTAYVWNLETGHLAAILRGKPEDFPNNQADTIKNITADSDLWRPIEVMVFSPDGSSLAIATNRGVWLWNTADWHLKATLSALGTHGPIVFSSDSTLIATARHVEHDAQAPTATRSLDAGVTQTVQAPLEVSLWSTKDGKRVTTLNYIELFPDALPVLAFQSFVRSMQFSPNGRYIATADSGVDGIVLWDTKTGHASKVLVAGTRKAPKQPKTLDDLVNGDISGLINPHSFYDITFNDDGSRVGCTCTDNKYRIWSIPSGTLWVHPAPAKYETSHMMLSPDGNTLAVTLEKPHGEHAGTQLELWDIHDLADWRLKISYPINSVAHTNTSSWQLGYFGTALWRFSPDSTTLSALLTDDRLHQWNVRTGMIQASAQSDLPFSITHATITDGFATTLINAQNGHTLATFIPIPADAVSDQSESDSRVKTRGLEQALTGVTEWFTTTPSGYFDCSLNAPRYVLWSLNGTLHIAERYEKRFHNAEMVCRSLRDEPVPSPKIPISPVPPTIRFLTPAHNCVVNGSSFDIVIEVTTTSNSTTNVMPPTIEIFRNDRPLSPIEAKPVREYPVSPPIGILDSQGRRHNTWNVRYHLTTPITDKIVLRAVAYDATLIGSDPADLLLHRSTPTLSVLPHKGNLYVLSVGVSQYRNAGVANLRNLDFPAADARAIAGRFRREGDRLYNEVHVTELIDEDATVEGIVSTLRSIQQHVNRDLSDTVILYLSGHSSTSDNRYCFCTYEFDPRNPLQTGLTAERISDELGGRLAAGNVILFADTCHAGGLAGINEILVRKINIGIKALVSCSMEEDALEDARWGHGAFTFALLNALDAGTDIVEDGIIRFNTLTFLVPNRLAEMMKASGRSEFQQSPLVMSQIRDLRSPIATSSDSPQR